MNRKNNAIHTKSITIEQGNVNIESRTVSGYLASFGNRDSYGDVIMKGAFAKSLIERGVGSSSAQKILYLYMHNMEQPIGRFTKLEEDEKGLYFEAEIDPIPLGDQVLTQYSTGTLNQHSIGFYYIWDKTKYEEESDTYYLFEVMLVEGSVVTFGANSETPFTGFKSMDSETCVKEQFDSILEQIEDQKIKVQLQKFMSNFKSLVEYEPTESLINEQAEAKKQAIEFLNEIKKVVIKTN
jgi:HK97 family phage prohead protease